MGSAEVQKASQNFHKWNGVGSPFRLSIVAIIEGLLEKRKGAIYTRTGDGGEKPSQHSQPNNTEREMGRAVEAFASNNTAQPSFRFTAQLTEREKEVQLCDQATSTLNHPPPVLR